MKKIEPVWFQYRIKRDDGYSSWKRCAETSVPLIAQLPNHEARCLYTDDALQAVAEAVLSKVQEEINKHVILDDEDWADCMFNRGLDKADAIVGDFDIASLVSELKG